MLQAKRTISSLLLAAILIGGAWFVSKTSAPRGKVSSVQAVNSSVSEEDKDKDGLKDWEEMLWKTDANNPDTDGDGTSDGAEITFERDPLVAGPNDSLQKTALDSNALVKQYADDKKLNLSSSISRSMLSTVLDKNSDPLVAGKAMDALIASKLPKSKDYNLTSLNIVQLTTPESFRQYGNSLALILTNDSNADSELAVIARAIESNDEKELDKLDPIVSNLQRKIDALVSLPVPYTVSNEHVAVVRSMDAARYDISNLKSIFSDPVLAYFALSSYRKSSDQVLADLSNLKAAVKMNVFFVDGEPGFNFFK